MLLEKREEVVSKEEVSACFEECKAVVTEGGDVGWEALLMVCSVMVVTLAVVASSVDVPVAEAVDVAGREEMGVEAADDEEMLSSDVLRTGVVVALVGLVPGSEYIVISEVVFDSVVSAVLLAFSPVVDLRIF
ncbi:hypothetical protein AAES_118145 [Amazona aestiva]|uniref:Uncharacterized protein n=1 Tax=Amazona aestiva TaxID=12930 RepID=A0A0Q3PPZ5_AMAAE|nr:hypothetical protein AAES_118145 [Amazona aestiva]